MTQPLLTAPISCAYFQTAPEVMLYSIENLLCLLETTIGFWGRFTSFERVGRLKRDTPLRPTNDAFPPDLRRLAKPGIRSV